MTDNDVPDDLSATDTLSLSVDESDDKTEPSARVPYDEEPGPNEVTAHSSASAAISPSCSIPVRHHCVVCSADYAITDVIQVPCGHRYCRGCLAQLFESAMHDEYLFPPKCCDFQEIPLSRVESFLPAGLCRDFGDKHVELSTKQRTYCHNVRCSAFIPPQSIIGNVATCQQCAKTTCALCKGTLHTGDCPEDVAFQQLLELAEAEWWQRCYSCSRIVELIEGCNHIECPCGADFCYLCGQPFGTCDCADSEDDLLDDDGEGVDEHLSNDYGCAHPEWHRQRGAHRCEKCSHYLRQYIFECRQCRLMVCQRCLRNRL